MPTLKIDIDALFPPSTSHDAWGKSYTDPWTPEMRFAAYTAYCNGGDGGLEQWRQAFEAQSHTTITPEALKRLVRSLDARELFDDKAVQPPLLPLAGKPITCRACGLSRPAVQIGILLCEECGVVPAQTRAHIADIVARTEATFYAAHERLDALIAQADDATRERWERVQAALVACGGIPSAKLAQSLEKTRQLNDGLSLLICAHDATLAAAGALGQVRQQAAEARAELHALTGEI